MALIVQDRVLETCSAPGTGTVSLLGATTGYQSFSTIGNNNTTYYTIADQSGPNWEVGVGVYTASGSTLTRTTVLASSNGGSLTNFNSGTQNVFVTYPAEKSVNLDASGNVSPLGTIASGTWQGGTIASTYGGTGVSSYSAGDMLYYASGSALSKLSAGTIGQVLTSTGSAPQWSSVSSVAVSTFSAGTTGLTPNTPTAGAVVLAGTLALANGGTGATTVSGAQTNLQVDPAGTAVAMAIALG